MENKEMFDHVFLGILQHLERVEPFLDAVFCFLARRTDFFRLMHSSTDKMGFPPGVAEKITMGIFRKYQKLILGDEAPASVPETRKKEIKKKAETKVNKEEAAQKVFNQPNQNIEQPVMKNCMAESEESTCYVPEVVQEEVVQTISNKTNSLPQSGEHKSTTNTSAACSEISLSTSTSSEPKDKGQLPCKSAEAYNGAIYDHYHWSQSHKDIDVYVHLPKNTPITKKDIGVEISSASLKVYLKNGLKNDEGSSVLLDGVLQRKVLCEESIWSFVPKENITVNLEKAEERWWTALLQGEPEIDKSRIDSTKNITEFDEQTQSDFERVMYDNHQKQLGKPTSKEQETHELLKKAWNAKGSPFAGTPFDPSTVNISG